MIENPNDIELNQEDNVQALMGRPPGWFLYWGMTVVAFTTVLLLTLGWVMRYPDVVVAPVRLTTEQPAIRVHAQRSAKLDQLLVKDQQEVKAGDLIAVLDNPAEFKAVQQLDIFIQQAKNDLQTGNISTIQPQVLGQLGELEAAYAEFRQLWSDYQRFVRRSGTFAKIRSLRDQIKELAALNKNIQSQIKTMEEELAVARTKTERLRLLKDNGDASIQQVEEAQAAYLQGKRQLESQSAQIINNNVRTKQLEIQIIDLKQNRKDGTSSRELAVQERLQSLEGLVANWKQQHLILAPVNGVIAFSRPLPARSYVQANESLLAILPQSGSQAIVGKALLPLTGSGKVKQGQEVGIRLAAFPYQEFGVLRGRVHSKSLLPENNQILVDIQLDKGMETSYQIPVSFTQEMQGHAHIITKDRRFLERILDRIWSVGER